MQLPRTNLSTDSFGRIYLSGTTDNAPIGGTGTDFFIAKYLSEGTLE